MAKPSSNVYDESEKNENLVRSRNSLIGIGEILQVKAHFRAARIAGNRVEVYQTEVLRKEWDERAGLPDHVGPGTNLREGSSGSSRVDELS